MAIGTDEDQVQETYDVFDFSKPCPPDCDDGNPLFIGSAADSCD